MKFFNLKYTYLTPISLFFIIASTLFYSCGEVDGITEVENIPSPYSLKLDGINITHGIEYQISLESIFPNDCDTLFGGCPNDTTISYFITSFGINSQKRFYFIIKLDSTINDLEAIPDMAKLIQDLPTIPVPPTIPPTLDSTLLFTSGDSTDGITDGNVYLGNLEFPRSFTKDQPYYASFIINEIKNAMFNNQKVVDINFNIIYDLYDEFTGITKVVNGNGNLPFILKNTN